MPSTVYNHKSKFLLVCPKTATAHSPSSTKFKSVNLIYLKIITDFFNLKLFLW